MAKKKLFEATEEIDTYLDKEYSDIYNKLDSCPYFDVDYIRYFKAMEPTVGKLCDEATHDLYVTALEDLEKDRDRWRYTNVSNRIRAEIYYKTLRRLFIIKEALLEVGSALHVILDGIDV